jgi:hypothetical protein
MHPTLITAVVGVVLILVAWGMWAAVRRWNRTRAIMAAAPVLPIKLVNVWDTVWIRGEMWCDQPQVVPHFDYSCVYFTYRLEEKVTKTRTNSEGKTETYTQWETRQTLSGCAPFAICQATMRCRSNATRPSGTTKRATPPWCSTGGTVAATCRIRAGPASGASRAIPSGGLDRSCTCRSS